MRPWRPSLAARLPSGVFLAALGIAGVWFGFPNPIFHLPPLVLLYPPVLAALALEGRDARSAFVRAFLTGALASAAALYWIAVPVHEYGGLTWLAGVACGLLLGCYLGLYAGIFGLAVRLGRQGPFGCLGTAIAGGCMWMILEEARGVFFSGFPWLSLSAAFAPWPAWIQGASLVGAYGLSGLLVMSALAAFFAFRPPLFPSLSSLSSRVLCGVFSCLLLAALAGWGAWRVSRPAAAGGEPLHALMVQGNIEQDRKWAGDWQRRTLARYLSLTGNGISRLGEGGRRLVIWPETALPFFFQSDLMGRFLERRIAAAGVPFLFGAPGFEKAPDLPRQAWPVFNRAYLVEPGGGEQVFYEKEHLVPFGEYLPSFLDFPALEVLFQGVGAFAPGERTAPLKLGDLALGVLICYETIFPELARERVAQGADILVNISNDAWFGRTSAPFQHLHQTVMRAVEENRWVLRATNTGITAVIDARGRIALSGPLFAPWTAVASVPPVRETTFFFRHGEAVFWGALATALIFVAAPSVLARKGRRHSSSHQQ